MNSIVTERFNLRKVDMTDDSEVFAILRDKEVTKYLNLPKIENVRDVRFLLTEYLDGNREGNKFPFAICDKESGKFRGVFLIKLDLFDEDCFEFTIYLKKDAWNKGIYSEVLPYMIHFCFNEIGTNNFRGFVMSNNTASAKVLLKNHFVLEKIFNVEGLTEKIESYLLTRDAYNIYY